MRENLRLLVVFLRIFESIFLHVVIFLLNIVIIMFNIVFFGLIVTLFCRTIISGNSDNGKNNILIIFRKFIHNAVKSFFEISFLFFMNDIVFCIFNNGFLFLRSSLNRSLFFYFHRIFLLNIIFIFFMHELKSSFGTIYNGLSFFFTLITMSKSKIDFCTGICSSKNKTNLTDFTMRNILFTILS